MAMLRDTLMPSQTYNNLPYILDVADVPTAHRADIDDLLELFREHRVPPGVRIKLVHKHFDASAGEVMVARALPVAECDSGSSVSILGPMSSSSAAPLAGLNYLVDADGRLQAYEYSPQPGPDLSQHGAFLAEFSRRVAQRGLQRKLGLHVGAPSAASWSEFELPLQRGTVVISKDVALPPMPAETSINTEWEAGAGFDFDCYGHCTSHCSHCWGHDHDDGDGGLYLAGMKIEDGSVLQAIVRTAVAAL